MCRSKLISSDIERAMKDAEDIHISIVLHQVGNPVMPVKQDANVTGRGEPALSFRRPPYLCHERMRRAMSSFEITRFASESASPRSTMT